MAETTLGNVLEFFRGLGVYDVILPFILTFTIVYAILERTKVLGTEGEGTRKNLNAMVAFVIAFLVIASSKLVGIVTQVSSQVIILLMLGVFFLMLAGTFYTEKEISEQKGIKLENPWKAIFMTVMALGIIAIFLDAIKTDQGYSWLEVFIGVLAQSTSNTAVASIILLILVIGFVVWVTKPKKKPAEKGD